MESTISIETTIPTKLLVLIFQSIGDSMPHLLRWLLLQELLLPHLLLQKLLPLQLVRPLPRPELLGVVSDATLTTRPPEFCLLQLQSVGD